MKILAIANQKGSAGKSTTAAHCAYSACDHGLRVLLVDLDGQGSLSTSFPPTGMHEGESSPASALFSDGAVIVPEVLDTGLAILRSDDSLSMLSGASRDGIKRPARYLRDLASQFDLCIIDTPGVLGFNPPMTIGALVAADAVVCPFGIGLYEAKAMGALWTYLKGIKEQGYNPRLRLMGLLPSRIQTTSKDEMVALQELRDQLGAMILPLMLGERAAVKKAIRNRKPVWRGTKGAGHMKAAQEWREATTYILTNLGALK